MQTCLKINYDKLHKSEKNIGLNIIMTILNSCRRLNKIMSIVAYVRHQINIR